MHRLSRRIVAPLFLLLVAAVIFVPEVRGDELLNFTVHDIDTLTFTLPQNPVPDGAGTDSFEFIQLPVFASFMPPGMTITYDIIFSRDPGLPNFEMFCDPFTFSQTLPPFFHCDFIPRIDQTATPIWTGSGNDPTFIPGVYDNGALIITEQTPEPSTLALLLMTFATLFLLAVGVRPSHR